MKAFLLIGQSNMSGRGNLDDLTDISNENVFVLRENGMEIAKEPVVRDRPFSAQGMTLAFASCVYMLTGEKVCLLPASLGGSPLKDWMPGESLFENAVSMVERAINMGMEISGILWHQGESDSTEIETAETYEDRLTEMLTALLKRLNALGAGSKENPVPVIMGELGGYLDRNPKSLYHDRVNDALHAVSKKIPACACVFAKDLPDKGDALHFSALSQRRLGIRYASAWADIVFGKQKKTLPVQEAEYV